MLLSTFSSDARARVRRWLPLCAVVALAAFLWSVGVGGAAPGDPKPANPEKPAPRKDTPQPLVPDLEGLFPEFGAPPGVDAERWKEMRDAMRRQMEMMMKQMNQPFPGMVPFGGMGGFGFVTPFNVPETTSSSRLGVAIEKPSATLVEQLDLPAGQGLVVRQVQADSPADKAGLKAHDVLLEFNGKSVASDPQALAKLVEEGKAGDKVDVVVLRRGRKETVKGVTLPEAKPARPRARQPQIDDEAPANRRGVTTTVFRNGDRFTGRHQEGDLILTVTGTVAGDRVQVGEIKVQDGDLTDKYPTVEKVPEKYRAKVKELIDMSEKGAVKVEIQ